MGSDQTEFATPVELRITEYDDTDGVYLFYCDDDGSELTDTYHDSASDAMNQAEWEFNVRPDEWTWVPENGGAS